MKNYKNGFIGIVVIIAIVVVSFLGYGAYKAFHEDRISEGGMNISAGDDFPSDYKPADHSPSNINTDEKKNSVMSVKSAREYDSEEINIIHSDTNRKVTILGTNFISCDKPMNCEELVYIGTKSFNVMIPTLSEFLSFIPEGLEDGIYDLYVYNTATGQKSNSIKIKNVNLTNVANKEISNWKTYKNEEYEFEFKYPSDWRMGSSIFDGRGVTLAVSFCPPQLFQGGDCKYTQPRKDSYLSMAPVLLYVYPKVDLLVSTESKKIWQDSSFTYELVLNDASYSDMYNQITSTFKLFTK